VIDLPEKTCDRCHRTIVKSDGYSETDYGSGIWVHWPNCPPEEHVPKEPARPAPPSWESVSEAVVKEAEIPTFTPALLGLVKKAWETKTDQRFWEWFITPNSDGVAVTLSGTAKPHEFFPKEIIEKMHYDETQKIFVTKSSLEHHSEPEKICERCGKPIKAGEMSAETDTGSGKYVHWTACPPEPSITERLEAQVPMDGTSIVDGLTWKDYYGLRDLRLLLWGLEKELVGKYGIIEAEPLAAKVRDLIKKKIEQITSKIDSTPEHHSSGNPDHSNPGFPPQYTDFENWLKKAQDMTIEQFQALPQDRKDFIYGLFKSLWGNPRPPASTGNPDGIETWRKRGLDHIQRPPF
jgi:hypothetical protein